MSRIRIRSIRHVPRRDEFQLKAADAAMFDAAN
jgi:hypothetical protein